MSRNKELMAATILDSFANAITTGMGIIMQGRQDKAKQKIDTEKLEMARETFKMKKIDHVYKNIDRIYEYGGTDPISGKVIKPEESRNAVKHNILMGKTEEAKIKQEIQVLKLKELRKKTTHKGNTKPLSVSMEKLILNKTEMPSLFKEMSRKIQESKELFGKKAFIMEGGLGRTIGEVADLFGEEKFLDLHNDIEALNSFLGGSVARYLKATQGARPSDFDWKMYEKMLPKSTDTYEGAVKKLNTIMEAYTNAYNRDMDRLERFGYSKEVIGERMEFEPVSLENDKEKANKYLEK